MGPLVLPGIYAVSKGLAIIQITILALQAVIVTYMTVNESKEEVELVNIAGYRNHDSIKGNAIATGLYTSIYYDSSVESPWAKPHIINLNLEKYRKMSQNSGCTQYRRHISICLEIHDIHYKIKDTYTTDKLTCQQKECRFHITYEASPKYNNLFKSEAMFYNLTGIKTIFNTPIRTSNIFYTGLGKYTAWWQPVLINLKGKIYYKDNQDDDIIDSGFFELDVYQFEKGSIVEFGGLN